jgi:hypothetical protein
MAILLDSSGPSNSQILLEDKASFADGPPSAPLYLWI